jgi:hypothetical protein
MLCRNNKDRFYRFFKKERENNYRTLREIILPAGPLCGDVSACGIVALRRPLRRFSHAVRMPQPPPLARCGALGGHAAAASLSSVMNSRRLSSR